MSADEDRQRFRALFEAEARGVLGYALRRVESREDAALVGLPEQDRGVRRAAPPSPCRRNDERSRDRHAGRHDTTNPLDEDALRALALPPGFDAAALESGPSVSDRYQVGARVTGSVACAWFDRWAAARRSGGAATEHAAVEAMQTARDWKILKEMEPQGAWSEALWAYADAMRGDGTWHGRPLMGDVEGGLGCDMR